MTGLYLYPQNLGELTELTNCYTWLYCNPLVVSDYCSQNDRPSKQPPLLHYLLLTTVTNMTSYETTVMGNYLSFCSLVFALIPLSSISFPTPSLIVRLFSLLFFLCFLSLSLIPILSCFSLSFCISVFLFVCFILILIFVSLFSLDLYILICYTYILVILIFLCILCISSLFLFVLPQIARQLGSAPASAPKPATQRCGASGAGGHR